MECLAYYQVDEKCGLLAGQKELELRWNPRVRENVVKNSEPTRTRTTNTNSSETSSATKDMSLYQQPARNLSRILAIQVVDLLFYLADFL